MLRAWFAPIPLASGEERNGILLPKVSPGNLSAVAKTLKSAAKQLRELSVFEIAQKLEFVARQWQRANLPEREKALKILPKFSPFSEPVCEQAIDALMEPLTATRLLGLLDEILGDRKALDEFVERAQGVKRKAFGANLALLVLAGNIVGLGVWDIAFCLLCKTPVLVKPSSDEPVLPALFAQSLARLAPNLASSVSVIPFPSEREDLLNEALEECDAVIVNGSDETVQSVKRRTPAKTKVIERGHRFSIAVVSEEFANEQIAELMALDVARFDQRGCLSPQVCFVICQGAGGTEREFGEKLSRALERMSEELPPNLSEGEKSSIVQFRLTCEMLGATVLTAPGLSWAVAIWGQEGDGNEWRKVSCSARVIHIVAVPSLDSVLESVRPFGKFLQAVAVAMGENEARRIAEELGQIGVSRVCPVGQLQLPPVEWSQDGKHLVAELVRWCDLEPIYFPPKESGWFEVFRGDSVQAIGIRSALEQQGIPVNLVSDIDPSNPDFPVQRVLIPSHYAEEARKVLAGLKPSSELSNSHVG